MDPLLWAFMPSGGGSGGRGGENEREIRQAGRDAATATREVAELKEKIRHLELISRAIWELLRESAKLTEADLLQKVRDVDLDDTNASAKQCGDCSRPNSAKRLKCLYCGADLPQETAFEAI